MTGRRGLPALPTLAVEVLESIHQHRLLTTAQIRALHAPAASSSWMRKVLGALHRHELIDDAKGPGRSKLWFITAAGAEAIESIPTRAEPRRRVGTPAQAAGPLRAHTLAVNQACIAFVLAASQRGDECGPLSWRHEIAHRLSARAPRGPAGLVIADALLSYLQLDGRAATLHQRFLELDRGTIPVEQLAAKLARYSTLRAQPEATTQAPAPDWREHYQAFPELLIVIATKPDVAHRRIARTLALYGNALAPTGQPAVPARFVALSLLAARGPFAPVFISAEQPDRPCDWLGNTHQPTGKVST